MNLNQIPEEEEILGLLDKIEGEQIDWIRIKGIFGLCMFCTHHSPTHISGHRESLADLSDRLWRLAVEKCIHVLGDSMLLMEAKMFPKEKLPIEPLTLMSWWQFHSTSIHRIVAALLALKRAGVNEI